MILCITTSTTVNSHLPFEMSSMFSKFPVLIPYSNAVSSIRMNVVVHLFIFGARKNFSVGYITIRAKKHTLNLKNNSRRRHIKENRVASQTYSTESALRNIFPASTFTAIAAIDWQQPLWRVYPDNTSDDYFSLCMLKEYPVLHGRSISRAPCHGTSSLSLFIHNRPPLSSSSNHVACVTWPPPPS